MLNEQMQQCEATANWKVLFNISSIVSISRKCAFSGGIVSALNATGTNDAETTHVCGPAAIWYILRKFWENLHNMGMQIQLLGRKREGGRRSLTSLSFLIQLFARTWLLGCWQCLTELSLTSGFPALEWGERLQSLCTSFITPTLRVKGDSKNPDQEKKWCLHVMCLKDLQRHCYLGSTAS